AEEPRGHGQSLKRAARHILTVALLLASAAAAQEAPGYVVGIGYQISLLGRAQHVLHVTMRPAPSSDLRVQLPVWNGLYQVRDFSQYVLSIRARDTRGNAVDVRAIDKNTWSVPNADVIEYDIVAQQSGPFGAEVNEQHAFLNLAEVLMYPVNRRQDERNTVVFSDVPDGWKLATSMRCTVPHPLSCTAENYDRMVDSPVEIGAFAESDFEQDGISYRVVVDANPSDYDMKAVTAMARKVVAAEIEWMQDRPIDHYLFLYHFPRRTSGGAMEHAYSTAIYAPAERVQRDPLSLADVTAHEFFHLWNVKRIRPQSLEPVDYTKEQYTRALWFSEGVTSAVADYVRVRAGYLDERGYLAELAAIIRILESRPARLTQSVEDSSLDAWLEKYSYYEQPERSISYYNKGEIAGVLLDLQMREVSQGKKSLRDLFQWMNQHYAKQGKFFADSAGVEEAAETVTGADFRDFFARYVAGVDPIPYDKFFATVGLRLDKRTVTVSDAGFRTRGYGQPAVVASVDPASKAAKAGLKPGDIVQEFNGRAVLRGFETSIEAMRPGDLVRLKLSGAGGQREISFKLGSKLSDDYAFVELDGATAAQRARRAAWIRGESQ
ncbi:MAG: M61 family metallopeptidase, partial [Terriglobales bacterium]